MIPYFHDHIITMQYPLVIFLVIVSVQAALVFAEKDFYLIAFGWVANFVYLIVTEHTPHVGLPGHFGYLIQKYAVGTYPEAFDFIASTSFWYASRKHARWFLRVPRFKTSIFLVFFLGGHILSVSLKQILIQHTYLDFLIASLPRVLINTLALIVLSQYFKKLVTHVKANTNQSHLFHFDDTVHLLYIAAFSYASIQPLRLFLYPSIDTNKRIELAAFTIGFIAKSLIFLGIISLFVASAAKITTSIAEQRKVKEFSDAIDRLAHELGTPLSEIQNELADLKSMRPSDVSQMLDQIENAAARASALMHASPFVLIPIADSLSAAQKEIVHLVSPAKRTIFEKTQVFNLNTIIEIAQNAVKSTRNEAVSYQHQYSARCCMEGKPTELVQVVVNIFRNAHDSLLNQGGIINIRTINENNGKIKLIVRDNGEGITSENIPKIFQEGYTTRLGTGRGFGLAISKRLVEQWNGTIEVHSPPSRSTSSQLRGTEIVLTFPRKPCT